jgi:predicted ArsR family transcriptional regulator
MLAMLCGLCDPSGDAVLLTNCPLHSLAQSHPQLVCQINHALLDAFAHSLAPDVLEVRLDPDEDRCCVTLADNS